MVHLFLRISENHGPEGGEGAVKFVFLAQFVAVSSFAILRNFKAGVTRTSDELAQLTLMSLLMAICRTDLSVTAAEGLRRSRCCRQAAQVAATPSSR